MREKFDHSSFRRSGDMVGADLNLNGSRDLTSDHAPFMDSFAILSTKFQVSTKIRKAIQNSENGVVCSN